MAWRMALMTDEARCDRVYPGIDTGYLYRYRAHCDIALESTYFMCMALTLPPRPAPASTFASAFTLAAGSLCIICRHLGFWLSSLRRLPVLSPSLSQSLWLCVYRV